MFENTSSRGHLRADAQRNRDRILDVAEQHFSEHGVAGSMDGLAKRAGVGTGTLYRHFPNRDELLAALLAARDERLSERLEELRGASSDAASALHAWLGALVDWASAFNGLPAPLRDAMPAGSSSLGSTCEGYIEVTDEFLGAAKREGSARADVRARDLFLSALATSWVRGAAVADDKTPAALAELTRAGWATGG